MRDREWMRKHQAQIWEGVRGMMSKLPAMAKDMRDRGESFEFDDSFDPIECETWLFNDDRIHCIMRASELTMQQRSVIIDEPFQSQVEMFDFICDHLRAHGVSYERFKDVQIWDRFDD